VAVGAVVGSGGVKSDWLEVEEAELEAERV
jgi:hypothetical protein